jgi:hypothetical protein
MAGQVDILQTVQPILATLADASLAASDGVGAQVWLVGPGDICAECPRRSECPDQASCLHLVAVSGTLDPAAATTSRLPLRVGPVGLIPGTGETLVTRTDLPALGVAEAGWLRRSGVKAVAGLPLEHGRRVLGVLVVLAKTTPSDGQLRSLAGAARLGAEAIGNVEAYRTLAVERNRLAARNARLRSGLGLPEEPGMPPPAAVGPAAVPPASSPPVQVTAPPRAHADAAVAAMEPSVVLAGTGAMLHSERFTLPPLRSFAQIQREGILHALECTGWRVSGPRGAAAALGVKPTTLESKMKKLGIRRPPR